MKLPIADVIGNYQMKSVINALTILVFLSISTISLGSDSEQKSPVATSEWDSKWATIQKTPASIDYFDHWRVCSLKYRLRIYADLFKCLDLIELRKDIPTEKEGYREGHEFLIAWFRTDAFLELGQIEDAAKWAKRAYALLPDFFTPGTEPKTEAFYLSVGDANKFLKSSPLFASPSNNPASIKFTGNHLRILALPSIITALIESKNSNHVDSILQTTNFSIEKHPKETRRKLEAVEIEFALKKYDRLCQMLDEEKSIFRKMLGERVGNPESRNVIPTLVGAAALSVALPFIAADELSRKALDIKKLDSFSFVSKYRYMIAKSCLESGRTDRARILFDDVLADDAIVYQGNLYWSALYDRGRIALSEGNSDLATKYFEDAIKSIESRRSTIDLEKSKIGFVTNKQAVYGSLISAQANRGNWEEAFETIERSKSRAFVDLLAQNTSFSIPPGTTDNVRKLLTDAALSERQLGLPITSDIVTQRNAAIESRNELAKVYPEAGSLVGVQITSPSKILDQLPSDESLIEYYLSGEDLYILVLNNQGIRGVSSKVKYLTDIVRAFRTHIQEASPRAIGDAQLLYDILFRPVTEFIAGKKLTIIPHGILHYVPFSSLHTGKNYLVDTYEIRLMPSATALTYINRTKNAQKARSVLALGNPDIGNPNLDLPNAQIEAIQIGKIFQNSTILLRKDATKSALKSFGMRYSTLHIASHGYFIPEKPLDSGLLLAASNEDNGKLTASDLYSMRLDADLITLSACETGLGSVQGGDDVIGLMRGFFYAGASSVVSSLWQVDDAATSSLMTMFYRNLTKYDKREALRRAQVELKKTRSNPYFWAPFQLTGAAM